MRFSTYRNEGDLASLVERLYPSAIKSGRRQEAEAELLRLNPTLRELDGMIEGTPLLVPELEGVTAAGESAPAGSGMAEMLAAMGRALDDVRPRIEEALEREKEDADRAVKLAKSRRLRSVADKDPEMAEQLERTAESAKSRIKELDARKSLQKQALDRLKQDIETLVKQLPEAS